LLPRPVESIQGCGTSPREIFERLDLPFSLLRKLNVLGVDFDRQAVVGWLKEGLPARYGDAEDPEFPATLPLNQAQWVVSTIP